MFIFLEGRRGLRIEASERRSGFGKFWLVGFRVFVMDFRFRLAFRRLRGIVYLVYNIARGIL